MDLLGIRIPEFDTVVISSIALGVLVALGLVIREKAQGGENMKPIQRERAALFEAYTSKRTFRSSADQN